MAIATNALPYGGPILAPAYPKVIYPAPAYGYGYKTFIPGATVVSKTYGYPYGGLYNGGLYGGYYPALVNGYGYPKAHYYK